MVNLIHWTLPYLIFISVIGGLGFLDKKKLLYIASLVILWTGTFSVPGLGISAEKTFIFLVAIYVFLSTLENRSTKIPLSGLCFFVIGYLLLYSGVGAFLVDGSALGQVKTGFLQSTPYRGIFSTLMFMLTVCLVKFPFSTRNYHSNLNTILRIVFWSAVFVMSMLALQILFPFMDPFFSAISSDNTKEIGIDDSSLLGFRPRLFSSEPKYFGIAFGNVAAFAILQRAVRLPFLPKWTSSLSFIFACLLCLLMSASLSAIVGFLAGCGGMLYLNKLKNSQSRYFVIRFIGTLLAIFVVGFVAYLEGYFTQRVELYLRLMQGGFGGSSTDATLSTTAYILWMLDQPAKMLFGVGIGNGAFYAFDYISYSSGFNEKGFTSSRVPLIDLICGVGIVGAGLIYYLWFRWLSLISTFIDKLPPLGSKTLLFIRASLCFYIFAGLIYPTNMHVWLFFGLAFSLVAAFRDRLSQIGD